jgi:type I restriction enzyme S subunit
MTDSWRDTTIGCEMTLQRGFDITRSQQRPGSVPVVSSGGISSLHDTAMVKGPGVVLGRKGVVGSVYFVDTDYWPHDTTLWVKDFKGNFPRFVYYFFRGMLERIASMDVGSANPTLNRNHVHPIEIRWPLPVQQRAIAGVLGALDDKIEQNQLTAQALERLARAIFRAWFVDFEPVKAKAAGATDFPSMPQPVFDALPTRFVNSEIGPVPEGWNVGAVSDLAQQSKAQVKPQDHGGEIFEYFSIPAFDAGRSPVFEVGAAIKSNKFLIVDGCVLLSKLNPRIPRVWLPPRAREWRQIASTEFLILLPRDGFDRHYLYCQFQQSHFREDLAQGASGTSNSHQRVRPNDLLSKRVVIPPAACCDGFRTIAKPLFALLASNHAESSELSKMRNYLLPKLLSGAVRVKDAERLLETAQ